MQTSHSEIYLFRDKGLDHIAHKRYSWAMVYLSDALDLVKARLAQLQDPQEIELLISEVKAPCHRNLSLSYLKQGNYEDCIH